MLTDLMNPSVRRRPDSGAGQQLSVENVGQQTTERRDGQIEMWREIEMDGRPDREIVYEETDRDK